MVENGIKNGIKNGRKFRKYLPIGVLEDLGLSMGDLQSYDKLPVTMVRQIANGIMIEGEPFTKEDNFMDVMEVLSFLGEGDRMKKAKAKMQAKRSPKL